MRPRRHLAQVRVDLTHQHVYLDGLLAGRAEAKGVEEGLGELEQACSHGYTGVQACVQRGAGMRTWECSSSL